MKPVLIFFSLLFPSFLISQGVNKDTLMERELGRTMVRQLPKYISESAESAFFLAKIELGKLKSETRISFLNDGHKAFTNYIDATLQTIDFHKYFQAGDVLIIPFFFWHCEDLYQDNKTEFTRVNNLVWSTVYNPNEPIIQTVRFIRPVNIVYAPPPPDPVEREC